MPRSHVGEADTLDAALPPRPRRLASLTVDPVVVLLVQPCHECLVEFLECRDIRGRHLGQEGRADVTIERLDFAMSHRPIGPRVDDAVDGELGGDLPYMAGPVHLAIVKVNPTGHPVFLYGAPENQLHVWQVFAEAEAAVQDEPTVVVDKQKQIRPPHLPRIVRVGQPGSH
jgi:hypothetical protein